MFFRSLVTAYPSALLVIILTSNSIFGQTVGEFIKSKGGHLISGTDTAFVEWTDGYIQAIGYGNGAEAVSIARESAENNLLKAISTIDISPILSTEEWYQQSFVQDACLGLVKKAKLTESKSQDGQIIVTLRIQLFSVSGKDPVLAAVFAQFFEATGPANETAGDGSSFDKPESQNENSETPVEQDGDNRADQVSGGTAAETKAIITTTEKYFTPQLFFLIRSESGYEYLNYIHIYSSSEKFIPHFYNVSEKFATDLNLYTGKDLIRAKVSSDLTYTVLYEYNDLFNEWMKFDEKAVYFGKTIILFY